MELLVLLLPPAHSGLAPVCLHFPFLGVSLHQCIRPSPRPSLRCVTPQSTTFAIINKTEGRQKYDG